MLRHNVKNNSNEDNEVELSRRSFFGRLAVGAALTIAMPGVVNAAKSTAVKADKNHRLAQSSRSAVRLPKQVATHKAKSGAQASKVSANHAGKQQKLFAGNKHKSAHAEHEQLHTAHTNHRTQHNTRIHEVYTGKKRGMNLASHHSGNGRHHGHTGRSHSIIQTQREPVIEPVRESLFLSDYTRLTSHRALAFQNPHTGDKLSLTYFEQGRYLTDALDEISFLLRDHRTDDVHAIDPELLDQLHDLKQMLGLHQPFDVICGYRSPLTNARLHAEHAGVANNSFHMHGRAVDIRIERFDLRRIHNAALAMHRGGVGYYPGSNFIHLDTGTFRTWTL